MTGINFYIKQFLEGEMSPEVLFLRLAPYEGHYNNYHTRFFHSEDSWFSWRIAEHVIAINTPSKTHKFIIPYDYREYEAGVIDLANPFLVFNEDTHDANWFNKLKNALKWEHWVHEDEQAYMFRRDDTIYYIEKTKPDEYAFASAYTQLETGVIGWSQIPLEELVLSLL